MASITIYAISADPFSTRNIDIEAAYEVEVIDNDALLQDPDFNGGLQLDVTGVPGFSGTSQNFQTFESYSGEVSGLPVTFTLIQFSNPRYVIVTSGDVALGNTIANTSFAGTAAASAYQSLPSFVCFTPGSLILTARGQRRVETLKPGDRVVVADGRTQPVRWVGKRRLSVPELQADPGLCPIKIKAGCFAPGYPKRDLTVSPQHRIVVSSALLELMYFEPLMLTPAKGLIDDRAVTQLPPDSGVEYIHILFDKHELVNVEGIWSESFFPGDTTLSAMAPETRRELLDLFPNLMSENGGYGNTALPVLKPYEASLLQPDVSVPQALPMFASCPHATTRAA